MSEEVKKSKEEKEPKEELQEQRRSRRELLRDSAILAGSTVLGAGLLISGCQQQEPVEVIKEVEVIKTVDPLIPEQWDYEVDVVVVGAGGAGLPAALKAQAEGASVMIIDANWDTGGHCAVSGGNLHSGGGTEVQKKYGIEDSPDQYYLDHTTMDSHIARYNDRKVVRATADAMPKAFQFILDNGVLLMDQPPTKQRIDSVPRSTRADSATLDWVNPFSGLGTRNGPPRAGVGITRPLEKSARDKGIGFLMNYRLNRVIREGYQSGRTLGIEVDYNPTVLPGESTPLKGLFADGNIKSTKEKVTIKAKKGIILATGGHTSNVKFRTLFDPRLTEEYDGVAGDPYSFQDAGGEIAAMAVGASLGITANQTLESGEAITRPSYIGCQYGYRNSPTFPTSPIFKLIRATGLQCTSYEDVILVNMLGQRFWNEDDSTNYEFFAAAMSSVVIDGDSPIDARRVGGPTWAIFDADTVARRGWTVEPPHVDIEDGRFFSANTLEELATKIVNKYYEDIKMDPKVLVETVTKYNSYVDAKKDEDFGKESLDFKIQNGPFYAAWATLCPHDTLTGLRVNPKQQVIDIHGEVIPGLYAAGECAAGLQIHGLGRVITAGYIAGEVAAKEG